MTAESPYVEPPAPKPVGPLGAAFVDLVEDPPASDLAAYHVIHRDWAVRDRRRDWVRRVGIAAAVVLVGGAGVLGIRSMGGLSKGASNSAEAPGAASTGAGAGGDIPAMSASRAQSAVTGSVTEAGSCPPSVPLSAAQTSTVLAQLPGAVVEPTGCGAGLVREPARGAFQAGQTFIEVEIAEPAGNACAMLPAASPPVLCLQVDGHPGVLLSYAPGDRELSQAVLVRVGLVSGTRSVTVRLTGLNGAVNPFTADQLATLVEALARTP